MKKLISMSMTLIFCISIVFTLVGCDSSPISSVIIAHEQYSDKSAIEKALQPAELSKGTNVYASIYFIESPKGMKYTANWYFDGKVIETDEKEMPTNQHGVIVYTLVADKIKEGTLKLEIKYKDDVLTQKEITIK